MKVFWSLILGAPIVLAGLILCASIWLLPVGVLLIGLGCIPFYKTQVTANKKQVQRETEREARSMPAVIKQVNKDRLAADIVLVSCVKTKRPEATAAKDLYISPLFRKEREYAERRGVPWYILSAEHGLVDPEQWLAPYERYLPDESLEYQREWGVRVVSDLESVEGPLESKVIEIHANAAYVSAVCLNLQSRGAIILDPLRGLGLGKRLQWYNTTLLRESQE